MAIYCSFLPPTSPFNTANTWKGRSTGKLTTTINPIVSENIHEVLRDILCPGEPLLRDHLNCKPDQDEES